MAKLEVSTDLPLDPHTAWEHASRLESFGEWLSIHDGWRSDLPDTLAEGTTLQSVVSVKGMRNRVTWTIVELDAPHHVVLKGTGKGGTKFSMRLAVAARGDGSTLSMKIDLGGAPLFGPIGSGLRASCTATCSRRSTPSRAVTAGTDASGHVPGKGVDP